MRVEPVALSHQSLLETRFRKLAVPLSEYTFSNLYLFRSLHHFEVVFNEEVFIRGKTRDGLTYLMPTAHPNTLKINDIKECLQGCDLLFPIPEQWLSFFDAAVFESVSLEKNSDYFYQVESMREYPGRHLSGRRNLVRQFKDHYPDYRVEVLTASHVEDAIQVLEAWKCHTYHGKCELLSDYAECLEALHLHEKLGLKGRITYAEGKPVGFVLGEMLTPEVYLYNFAKGIVEYKGVYQFMYQEYAQTLDPSCRFINLEQDLGSVDLQHAKRAYLPDHLEPKYRISLRST